MSDWIAVKGHKEVPEGNWLVQLDNPDGHRGCEVQVMRSRPNSSIIGDHFAFDHAEVVAYHPLPERFEDQTNEILKA